MQKSLPPTENPCRSLYCRLHLCHSPKEPKHMIKAKTGKRLQAFFFALCFILLPLSTHASTVKVKVIHSRDQYPAGGIYPILLQLNISPPYYIHGPETNDEGIIPTTLSIAGSHGIKFSNIRFPQPEKMKFQYTRDEIEVISGEALIRARLEIEKSVPPGTKVLKGELSYQACASSYCLPPEKIPFSISVRIAPKEARATLLNQEMFNPPLEHSGLKGENRGWKLGAGLWVSLLGIFLGGLALNLTPCIYPLIPITVSYFGGRGGTIRGRTLAHGALYILGLAFTNSFLGLTASLSGGLLGSALQHPLVLLGIAGILVWLGLSFFGLWELRPPTGLMKLASRQFGGYSGTFFMGLTLGIVAAPCLGPFILGLLTYVGQKGDPFIGFVYFFVLSLGLGLPLALLGVFSAGLEKLPISGQWMVWVRKAFGWVLMLMAGYMLRPLLSHPLGRSALMAVPLMAAGIHLGWLDSTTAPWRAFPVFKKGLGVVFFAVGMTFIIANLQPKKGVEWVPYDPALLATAVQQQRPVILDFYADWCAPCRALEGEVFTDPQIVKLSRQFVLLKVNLTKRHPGQDKILHRYRIKGVPTLIFINAKGIEERALRIQSYVGREELLHRMKRMLSP